MPNRRFHLARVAGVHAVISGLHQLFDVGRPIARGAHLPDEILVHTVIAHSHELFGRKPAVAHRVECGDELGIHAVVTHPDERRRRAEPVVRLIECLQVFEIHAVRGHAGELVYSGACVPLPSELVDEIESQIRHRHLQLLAGGGGVDAASRQLGDELGVRRVAVVTGSLAAGKPAVAVEGAGVAYNTEVHNGAAVLPGGRRETLELAQRDVVARPAVAARTLTIAEGEADHTSRVTGLEQPLAVGRCLGGRRDRKEEKPSQPNESHTNPLKSVQSLDR